MTAVNDAWLFVRGNQSIFVTRMPMAMTLVVCGPGEEEHSHHFRSEESLDEFWTWYRKHLLGNDWVQRENAERRTRPPEPGAQPDRRRRPRE